MQNVVEFKSTSSDKLQWTTIVGVAVFHILAVWALFTVSWQNLAVMIVGLWVSGSLGIGLGYHRLLTHRGYKAPRWLERFLATCGTLAVQSGPLAWVTTHRIHHAFTETDKDPHSPRHGTYWSHIGWIFKGEAQNHDEATHRRYSPDLMRDPFMVTLDKYYWVSSVVLGLALWAIGGWSMVLWGIFLKTVIGWHSTWLVNSGTHLWGSQRFQTGDDSRNNLPIALLTFGEGWHNNHHAYPRSAKHGLNWKELDLNWLQIAFLEKIGIIKEVYAVDLEKTKNDAKPLKKAA